MKFGDVIEWKVLGRTSCFVIYLVSDWLYFVSDFVSGCLNPKRGVW